MNFKRVSASLCLVLFLNMSFVYGDIDDKKQDLDDTNQKIDEVKEKVDKTKEEKGNVEAELKELGSKITKTNSELQSIENDISNIKAQIEKTKKDIEETQKEIDEKNDLVNKRLRAMYKTGNNISYLHILLSSESIIDFIQSFDTIKKVTDKDHELLESMENQKKIIEAKKDKLTSQEKQLTLATVQLKAKKSELQIASREKSKLAVELDQSLQVSEQQYEELIEESNKIEQDIKRLEAEARRKLEEAKRKAEEEARRKAEEEAKRKAEEEAKKNEGNEQSNPEPNPEPDEPDVGQSQGYIWPTPGYGTITSPYGNRFHPTLHVWKMHTGIDIGAPTGASVVATREGVVIYSGWSGGYGNTVMITHDNGTTSLYAHNSALLVSEGAYVKQGQVISKIGSTGYSTGPHLHFEIRVNGKHQNPLNYVR